MNLILLFEEDFTDGLRKVRLSGRRLRHIREVHCAKVGDTLCAGLEGGPIGSGKVTFLDEEVLEMDIALSRRPPEPLPLTLVLALPRPKVLRRVLFSVTALGVKRIVLVNSYRVEKSFWESPVLHRDNIRKQLILGLEQSRDTILPEVLLRERFRPFVEDELPELARETLRIVAHPHAAEECPRGSDRPVILAIGPEGGFISYEIEKLASAGFSAVSLGDRVLPVETAVPFLISRCC
jgi:16S rRNA (uracil1498-N3)-methyltransferase